MGARSAARVRRASILTSQWGAGGAVLLGLAFWVAGPAIIDVMARAPEVQAEARTYLVWVALAPVIGIASWMFDGIFIGATMTREMRNAMLVSVAVYVGALFLLVPGLGNHGLWGALMVLNTARGVTMAAYYPRAERLAA